MQKLCCDLCPFTFFPGRHCRLSSRRGSIPDLEMAFGNEMAVHVSCRRGEGTDTVYIKHNFRTRTHSILRQHQILQVYKCLDRFFDSNHLYKHILRFCIRTLCSFGVVVSIRTYIQVVPGRAGGGSFRRKKNYIARKEFAYRMRARRPTSAMPKPFLCCERAFCCSMVLMCRGGDLTSFDVMRSVAG